MCILYSIEFWLPAENESADWERRVRRGLERPGTNIRARTVSFWECKGNLYAHDKLQCTRDNRRIGGCRGGRISEFCSADEDCMARIRHFERRCGRLRREANKAEKERWEPRRQEAATREWRQAYEDWQSAIQHHRDCPSTRANHMLYQQLVRAGIIEPLPRMSDAERLGRDPNESREPIEGITRQVDPPRRRY